MSKTGLFWVNFNPSDLEKAKQFMDNLKGDKTVDVLGLSRSMEAVSDILFPATSTLHKRIRYQIFVPSIIFAMYSRKGKFNPEKVLKDLEYQLQKTLINSGEESGVFGSSRGEALKYWPSLIYWSSLNALKFFGTVGLGRYDALEIIGERIKTLAEKNQDNPEIDPREIIFPDEFIKIFKRIFLNGKMSPGLTFTLNIHEANFFKDRFLKYFPNSVTTYILMTRNSIPKNIELFQIRCHRNMNLDYLLVQSKNFSHVAMGANYAYRWALCQAKKITSGERLNRDHLKRWANRNRQTLYKWKFQDLISATHQLDQPLAENGESAFLEKFIHLVFSNNGNPIAKRNDLYVLMQRREEEIKGRHMSHFNNPDLQAARNTLGEEDYKDYLFDYRWPQGKTNLVDIFNGLNRK